MKIIYEEDFSSSLKEMLDKHHYWIFAWECDPGDHEDADIFDRIEKLENGIKIKHLEGDQDVFKSGLNSRTELRPNKYKLDVGKEYIVEARVKFTMKIGAEFLQIMGRYKNGDAHPLLQLESRGDNINSRYKVYNANKWSYREKILDREDADGLWTVHFKADPDPNKGFIRIYKDKKIIWEKVYKTYEENNKNQLWIQYGIYKNTGTDDYQEIIYKNIGIYEPKPGFSYKGQLHQENREVKEKEQIEIREEQKNPETKTIIFTKKDLEYMNLELRLKN